MSNKSNLTPERMAALAAFTEESNHSAEPELRSPASDLNEQNLLVAGESEDDAQLPNKRVPLQKNPIAKVVTSLVIVGGVTFTIGYVITSMWSSFDKKQATAASVPAEQTTSVPVDTQAEESDRLKARLALYDQKSQVVATNQKQAQQQLKKLIATPRASAPALPPGSLAPGRNASPEQLEATAAVRQRPVPTNLPVLAPPGTIAGSGAVSALDPQQRWQLAALVGSYGVGSSRNSSVLASASSSVQQPVVRSQKVAQAQEINLTDEVPVLSGRASRGTPVLSRAAAELITPVVYESRPTSSYGAAGEFGSSDDLYEIRLLEPLRSPEGGFAFEAGTVLAVKILSVSPNGLVKMSAIAIFSGSQEIPLPAGAVTVRGPNGFGLIAHNSIDRGATLGSQDAGQAFWGALGAVGQLANQPITSTVSSGLGGVVSTVTTPPPNYVGGAIAGAAQQMVQIGNQRTQRATQEILNRPDMWQLNPGQRLTVVVNKSLTSLGY